MVVPKGKPFGFKPHSGPKRSWTEERKTDRGGTNIGLASWFFFALSSIASLWVSFFCFLFVFYGLYFRVFRDQHAQSGVGAHNKVKYFAGLRWLG